MKQHDFWEDAKRGIGCVLCPPRPANNEHYLAIAQLNISTLYLFRDQRFRGYSLLVFDARHATNLGDRATQRVYHQTHLPFSGR
ncbi:MAG: hypothetical protein AAGF95_09280 [Chloroflexota bacterium]